VPLYDPKNTVKYWGGPVLSWKGYSLAPSVYQKIRKKTPNTIYSSVLLYWELNLYCGFLIVKGGDPGPVVQEFLVLKVFL